MDDLLKNQRGAATIQAILLLPILIVAVIGGYEVWKTTYARQVMNDATYQAARLAAMQPFMLIRDGPTDYHFESCEDHAEALVTRYLGRFDMFDEIVSDVDVVIPNPPVSCGDDDFQVRAEITVDWEIARDWGVSDWIAFLDPADDSAMVMTSSAKILGAKRLEDVP